jgi:hypothetical protein
MSTPITQPSYDRPQLGLKPTKFNFMVPMFPDVTFSVQSAVIPSVTLGVASYGNPMQDVHLPGEKLNYTPLQFRLMVDEQLQTYTELYGWMRRLAFPDGKADLASAALANARFNLGGNPAMPMSDCVLQPLDSQNNPIVNFTFRGAFPIYLGELKFDTTEEGTTYLYTDVEFAFTYFTVDATSTVAPSMV